MFSEKLSPPTLIPPNYIHVDYTYSFNLDEIATHPDWRDRKTAQPVGYLLNYAFPSRNSNFTYVELGVEKGYLTEAVGREFPYASITGVEVDSTFLNRYQEMEIRNPNLKIYLSSSISSSVLGKFDEQSIDFLYVDSLHTYDHVMAEMTLWHPKMKVGGVIACHDYLNEKTPGVGEALNIWMIDNASAIKGTAMMYNGNLVIVLK